MSGEGYITKKNIEDYKNPRLEAAENPQFQCKQQSEEWQAYNKLQTDSTKLISNKRTTISGKAKDDSVLMQQVKEALGSITNFYTETTVPANKDEFQQQLNNLQEMYGTLKDHCKTYLDQRQGIWKNIIKGEGYRRYQMVKETQTKASVELAILKNRAQMVYNDFQGVTEEADRPLWVNVLAEARTTYLDLSKKDAGKVELTGGNCNSVIKLTSTKGEVAYIKEDSKNVPATQYTDTYISTLLESNLGLKAKNQGATEKEISDMIKVLSSVFAEENTDIDLIFWKSARSTKYHARDMRKKDVQRKLAALIIAQRPKVKEQLESFLHKPYGPDIFGEYAEYYSLHIKSYLIANNNVKMDKGSSITDRNVATSRLAELLGVPELIPASRKVKYKDQKGKDHQGILLAEAKGEELFETYNNVQTNNYKYEDLVFLQMNSLEILDVIASQFDRNNTNIFVESEGKRITKIRAIDNDMSFGKLTYKDIQKRNNPNYYLNTLEDQNGFCKLTAVDKRLYDSLMALTDEMVSYVFADLLSKDELKALQDRIKGVKALLQRSLEKNPNNFYIRDPKEDIYYIVNHAKNTQQNANCYLKTHHLLELSR